MAVPIEREPFLPCLRGHQQVLLSICNCEEILAVRKLVLEAFGYEVLTADGAEELEAVMNRPVDVAIVDYRAAGTNGELIAIRTKIIRPLTPIVMLVDEPSTVPESVARLVHSVVKRQYSPVPLLEEIASIVQRNGSHSGHALAARRIA